jgi:hypothetical protein
MFNIIFGSSVNSILAAIVALRMQHSSRRYNIIFIFKNYNSEIQKKFLPLLRKNNTDVIVLELSNKYTVRAVRLIILFATYVPINFITIFSPRPYWIASQVSYKFQTFHFYGDGFGLAVSRESPDWLAPKKRSVDGANFGNRISYLCQHFPVDFPRIGRVQVSRVSVLRILSEYTCMVDQLASFFKDDCNVVLICLGAFSKYKRMTIANEFLFLRDEISSLLMESSSIKIYLKRHPGTESLEYLAMLEALNTHFNGTVIILDRFASYVPLELVLSHPLLSTIIKEVLVTSAGPYLSCSKLFKLKCRLFPEVSRLSDYFNLLELNNTFAQRNQLLNISSYDE